MFNRVRDGLVYPKLLIAYRKDRVWKALLFILFFSLLLATSSIIDIVTFEGEANYFSYIDVENVNENEDNCLISNYVLSCDTAEKKLLYEDALLAFYLDTSTDFSIDDYGGFDYNFVLNGSWYYVVFSGVILNEGKISDLPEEFNDLTIDFSDEFYTQLFTGVDLIIEDVKAFWGTAVIVSEVILNFVLFLAFVLINTAFLRRRFKVVPYKEIFVMSTYASTAIFILMVFNSMINLSFYIVIILVLFAFRQTNALALEIDSILKANKNNND